MKIKIRVSERDIKHIQFMMMRMKDVYYEMTSEEENLGDAEGEFPESLLETIITMERICMIYRNKALLKKSRKKHKHYKPCKERDPYRAWTKNKHTATLTT